MATWTPADWHLACCSGLFCSQGGWSVRDDVLHLTPLALQVTWLVHLEESGAMCVSEGFAWNSTEVTVQQVGTESWLVEC